MSVDASRLRAAIERWPVDVMRATLPDVVHLMRSDHRVPRDTSELVRSLTVAQGARSTGTGATGTVAAPVIQASTTDRGARPHVIRPRRPGGLLVFYWPKAGGTVAFRHVNHPGNKARPWWAMVVGDAFREAVRDAAARTPLR